MTNAKINKRLDSIEEALAQLKSRVDPGSNENEWRAVAGSFANDRLFERAMKYGADYRKSLRPKARRRTKRK